MSDRAKQLAADLSISDKALKKLAKKHPERGELERLLKRWLHETADLPRLLGRQTGYTHIPSRAIGSSERVKRGDLMLEREAVRADYQNLYTLQSRTKWAERERVEKAEEEARQAVQQLAARQRDVLLRAAKLGQPIAPFIAAFERQVREVSREIGKAA